MILGVMPKFIAVFLFEITHFCSKKLRAVAQIFSPENLHKKIMSAIKCFMSEILLTFDFFHALIIS